LNLAGCHFPGLRLTLVIETLKVQDTVDRKMRPVGLERFSLRARFERDHRCANHQLAQE
jgi:hypothetical protein